MWQYVCLPRLSLSRPGVAKRPRLALTLGAAGSRAGAPPTPGSPPLGAARGPNPGAGASAAGHQALHPDDAGAGQDARCAAGDAKPCSSAAAAPCAGGADLSGSDRHACGRPGVGQAPGSSAYPVQADARARPPMKGPQRQPAPNFDLLSGVLAGSPCGGGSPDAGSAPGLAAGLPAGPGARTGPGPGFPGRRAFRPFVPPRPLQVASGVGSPAGAPPAAAVPSEAPQAAGQGRVAAPPARLHGCAGGSAAARHEQDAAPGCLVRASAVSTQAPRQARDGSAQGATAPVAAAAAAAGAGAVPSAAGRSAVGAGAVGSGSPAATASDLGTGQLWRGPAPDGSAAQAPHAAARACSAAAPAPRLADAAGTPRAFGSGGDGCAAARAWGQQGRTEALQGIGFRALDSGAPAGGFTPMRGLHTPAPVRCLPRLLGEKRACKPAGHLHTCSTSASCSPGRVGCCCAATPVSGQQVSCSQAARAGVLPCSAHDGAVKSRFSSAQGGAEAPGQLAATGPATDPAPGPASRPPRSRLRAVRSTGQRRALKPLYPSQDAEEGPQQAESPKAGGGGFRGALQLSSSDEELAVPAPPARRVPTSENEAPALAQAPAEALEALDGVACAASAGPRPLKRLRRACALPTMAAARTEAAGMGTNPGRASDPGGLGRACSRAAGWDSQSSSNSGAGGAGAGSGGAVGHSGGGSMLQGNGKGDTSGGRGAGSAAADVAGGNPFVSARTLEHGRQVRARDQAALSACSASLIPTLLL